MHDGPRKHLEAHDTVWVAFFWHTVQCAAFYFTLGRRCAVGCRMDAGWCCVKVSFPCHAHCNDVRRHSRTFKTATEVVWNEVQIMLPISKPDIMAPTVLPLLPITPRLGHLLSLGTRPPRPSGPT